jgi:hypothetical protein
MKKMKNYKAVIFLAVVLMAAPFASAAGDSDSAKNKIDANVLSNFINGINSENFGLCKCSIYLAGRYSLEGTVEPLINILNNNSKDCHTRVLAACALYKIGNTNGINAIRDAAQFECKGDLKEVCSLLYDEYLKTEMYAMISAK